MEIDSFQHQDFVWTWTSDRSSSRVSLWLPYFDGVDKLKGLRYRFRYNGGEFEADLRHVDFIMLYGASGVLPVEFLDALSRQRICLFVHRRKILRLPVRQRAALGAAGRGGEGWWATAPGARFVLPGAIRN